MSYWKTKTGLENQKDAKAFIEYSNNMQDVYKDIEEYNPSRNCNVLIVLDDMIADMNNTKTWFNSNWTIY